MQFLKNYLQTKEPSDLQFKQLVKTYDQQQNLKNKFKSTLMSNKNLKVYQIVFITEIKTLYLNVKFPCEIKMIWKRSNESAETQRVKLADGKALFNEKLQLNVNMYFDIKTNKFVEKKCIYSFLIFTDKGEKSAGSITYDLADFFNKRVYEVEQCFTIQKCPVKDTKVDMKIHYEESVQGGFDSMSQISVTSQMDTSASNPLDLSEMNESKDSTSEKSNSTVEPTNNSSVKTETKEQQKKQPDYTNLNDSDVQSEEYKSRKVIAERRNEYHTDSGKQNKIGQNIKGIHEVTHKLTDFASKFKQNLSYDLEEKKRQIRRLTEEVQSTQEVNKRLQIQLNEQKSLKSQFQNELLSMKSALSSNQGELGQKIAQLKRKLEQQKRNTQKLQSRLLDAGSKGEQEGKYIQEMKEEFKKEQGYLNQKIEKLSEDLKSQKGQRVDIEAILNRTEQNYSDLNEKYDRLLNKYEILESDLRKREVEIEEARINLDQAVQDLVQSLSGMF